MGLFLLVKIPQQTPDCRNLYTFFPLFEFSLEREFARQVKGKLVGGTSWQRIRKTDFQNK